MDKLISIGDKQIRVKEHDGQKVITFKEIDNVHRRADGTANRNFRENRDKFIAGIDYFELNGSEAVDFATANFVSTNPSKVRSLMLITESGYLMIAKSLTDDLAWEVQRQLVNNYFRAKDLVGNLNGLSPQLQVLINMELKQRKLERQLTDTRNQVTTIKDTIIQENEDWRKEVNKKLQTIGFKLGKYKEIRQESYELLEGRARCDLNTRLANYKERLRKSGASKTTINKANYLDVIGADERLREIYINIVKQMYVKYAA